jgi:hypothetical protein
MTFVLSFMTNHWLILNMRGDWYTHNDSTKSVISKPDCTHAHTHTLSLSLSPFILPVLEAPAESFFWNLLDFGRPIRFDILHGYKTCPLEAHFQNREQTNVTLKEMRRVRWLGDDSNVFSAKNCCTTSDVWLSALSWCRNHCPCHLLHRFLRSVSRNLCKICTQKYQ